MLDKFQSWFLARTVPQRIIWGVAAFLGFSVLWKYGQTILQIIGMLLMTLVWVFIGLMIYRSEQQRKAKQAASAVNQDEVFRQQHAEYKAKFPLGFALQTSQWQYPIFLNNPFRGS